MKKILIITLSGAILASCSRQPAGKPEVFTVRTTTAIHSKETDKNRSYPFISKPYSQTNLSFRISGPVSGKKIQSGQPFRKGEIILSIDNRDFLIQQQRAKALYEQTREEYQRIKTLYEKDHISGSAYEKAKADYMVAQSAWQAANYAVNDTRLSAPFNGYVQSVYVEPFQEIKASQTILSFIELDKLKAEVFIPQDIAAELQKENNLKNADITVCFDKNQEEKITPSEVYVSKNTAGNNLSYQLTAIIPNPNHKWLGGMSGTIEIQSASATEDILSLPQSAICHNKQAGNYVWTVKEGKAHIKPIKAGQLTGGKIEIKEGISTNDSVILTRHSFLSEGTSIIIKNN